MFFARFGRVRNSLTKLTLRLPLTLEKTCQNNILEKGRSGSSGKPCDRF